MPNIQATTTASSEIFKDVSGKVFSASNLPLIPANAAVVTKGTFDLLHAGHLALVAYCAQLAATKNPQLVVVVVESDQSVRTRKGSKRPIQTQSQRALQIALLSSVQVVIVAAKHELPQVLAHVQPAVYVKGMDTTGAMIDAESSGKTMTLDVSSNAELTALLETCRVVIFTDDGSLSTSALIHQIQTAANR